MAVLFLARLGGGKLGSLGRGSELSDRLHNSLEELIIEFKWGGLMCESKGFGIHNSL